MSCSLKGHPSLYLSFLLALVCNCISKLSVQFKFPLRYLQSVFLIEFLNFLVFHLFEPLIISEALLNHSKSVWNQKEEITQKRKKKYKGKKEEKQKDRRKKKNSSCRWMEVMV